MYCYHIKNISLVVEDDIIPKTYYEKQNDGFQVYLQRMRTTTFCITKLLTPTPEYL